MEYNHRYAQHKGTQFVFSDLGSYKPDEWNVYSEIKRKLVEDHRIPSQEIRFIQECTTDSGFYWNFALRDRKRHSIIVSETLFTYVYCVLIIQAEIIFVSLSVKYSSH